ncbi:hypothetical protein H696_03653 [Fonticula alba]|uniref:Uncharacterized protein n=1 Tax=Fonticula alba TaxID=691883 RepID=A0A058Z7E4_FONAL|nr:hypothetical protein H696_03653 [Fonticula alba]KCV70195.1 hypothetical protein H696_03653 [Fonticula alba]|eukprot:XP_009495801.1 hypothetical protein H696_03653 [Fonticula alba]
MSTPPDAEASAAQPAASVLIAVILPKRSIRKTFRFDPNKSIFEIKSELPEKLGLGNLGRPAAGASVKWASSSPDDDQLINPANYGLLEIHGSKGSGAYFLDDRRQLGAYNFPDSTALEFVPKRRFASEKEFQLNAKNNTRRNQKALIEAVMAKSIRKTRELLDKGLDPNFTFENGETPLAVAAANDDTEMILLLVQQGGAHLDYFCATDGRTPLHRAAQRAATRATSLLMDLAAAKSSTAPGVAFPDRPIQPLHSLPSLGSGATPLLDACTAGCVGSVRALLEAGARPSVQRQVTDLSQPIIPDNTPRAAPAHNPAYLGELHAACHSSSHEVVELLLGPPGLADPDVTNETGNTPMHVCAIGNQRECLQHLMRAGCVRNFTNRAHSTAAQTAVTCGFFSISTTIASFKDSDIVPLSNFGSAGGAIGVAGATGARHSDTSAGGSPALSINTSEGIARSGSSDSLKSLASSLGESTGTTLFIPPPPPAGFVGICPPGDGAPLLRKVVSLEPPPMPPGAADADLSTGASSVGLSSSSSSSPPSSSSFQTTPPPVAGFAAPPPVAGSPVGFGGPPPSVSTAAPPSGFGAPPPMGGPPAGFGAPPGFGGPPPPVSTTPTTPGGSFAPPPLGFARPPPSPQTPNSEMSFAAAGGPPGQFGKPPSRMARSAPPPPPQAHS